MTTDTDTTVKHGPVDASFTNFISRLLKPKQEETQKEDTPEDDTPKMFQVILHNDPNTPGLIVMNALMQVFEKSPEQAAEITYAVHRGGSDGKAVIGVYPRDVAETKVVNAVEFVKREVKLFRANWPLTFTLTIEETEC